MNSVLSNKYTNAKISVTSLIFSWGKTYSLTFLSKDITIEDVQKYIGDRYRSKAITNKL